MTKVRGKPGPGKLLTADFDEKAKVNAKGKFPHLNQTKALVLLSIQGNKFCTGEHLGATVAKALATHKFTTFLIADEIYWHNLKSLNCSLEEEQACRAQALELGAQYINAQLPYFLEPLKMSMDEFDRTYPGRTAFDKVQIINSLCQERELNFEIRVWKEWIEPEQVPPHYVNNQARRQLLDNKAKIEALYGEEDLLKTSILDQAQAFARRHPDNGSLDLLVKRSQDYLIEESPMVMLLSAALDYNFIVYPGEMPKPFQATKDYFIKDVAAAGMGDLYLHVAKPYLLANWLEVNFSYKDYPVSHASAVGFFPTQDASVEKLSKQTKRKSMVMGEASSFFAPKKRVNDEELSQITAKWKGITQGILAAPNLSKQDKIEYLLLLLEKSPHFSLHPHIPRRLCEAKEEEVHLSL